MEKIKRPEDGYQVVEVDDVAATPSMGSGPATDQPSGKPADTSTGGMPTFGGAPPD
jgi:hypothetical protein